MSDVESIGIASRQFLEQQIEKLDRAKAQHVAALRALDRHPEPQGHKTSRFTKKSGKPIRPIEAMQTLLRENGGEMPSSALYELMQSEGCFGRKKHPESTFKLSIGING
jgi:hypothetical protein